MAVIQDQKVFRYMPAIPYKKPVTFYHEMKNSIYVLKLIPGMKPDVLSYIFKHYDCVVIESFGVGGLPESIVGEFYKEMTEWVRHGKIKEMTEWVRHGKIVVMTTQVANEGSNMTVYEVGKKVKQDFDLIEAYDMTLEAVITKLMWIMSMEQMSYAYDMTLEAVITKLMWIMSMEQMSYAEVKERFYSSVNHDILFHE